MIMPIYQVQISFENGRLVKIDNSNSTLYFCSSTSPKSSAPDGFPISLNCLKL